MVRKDALLLSSQAKRKLSGEPSNALPCLSSLDMSITSMDDLHSFLHRFKRLMIQVQVLVTLLCLLKLHSF